jgi:hypothetical protein
MPQVVAVAGVRKARAILAALRSGLVTTLVTDDTVARTLLAGGKRAPIESGNTISIRASAANAASAGVVDGDGRVPIGSTGRRATSTAPTRGVRPAQPAPSVDTTRHVTLLFVSSAVWRPAGRLGCLLSAGWSSGGGHGGGQGSVELRAM